MAAITHLEPDDPREVVDVAPGEVDDSVARPAYPSPSPSVVPGLSHVMLIELRQALISYKDYHMYASRVTVVPKRALVSAARALNAMGLGYFQL